MSGLEQIPVTVVTDPGPTATGNIIPILNEIRHALSRLDRTGEPTTIDLSAIPFGPGEREDLLGILGKGEVEATLDALGESRIHETAYPGAWVVTHHSPLGLELTTHIEITRAPSLLQTPQEDVGEAAAALSAYLREHSSGESA